LKVYFFHATVYGFTQRKNKSLQVVGRILYNHAPLRQGKLARARASATRCAHNSMSGRCLQLVSPVLASRPGLYSV
jgi:hypothetical protein